MSETTYRCPVCGRQETVAEGGAVPICCGVPMEPLPFCTAMDAEQARSAAEDGPCDDATSSSERRGRS